MTELEKPPIPKISKDTRRSEELVIQDASSIIASKLPPQLGTDPILLGLGKYDLKKLSRITDLERIWMAWFSMLPKYEGGNYSKEFVDNMLALSLSVDGFNPKLIVQMQQAVTGGKGNIARKDARSWIQRNLTMRSKPKYEYVETGEYQE